MICDLYRTKVILPTVLKLFAVNCFINNLTSIKRSKRKKKEIRVEKRETSENLNKVNVGFSTRRSASLTASVILISLKDISLLFLFNMKISL